VESSPIKDLACGRRGRLEAGSPAGSVDPHLFLEGGGGDAPPSPAGLFQSHLEGGSGDAAQCGDDAETIIFTVVSFYFLHTY
jgi:hypothetical protein